MEREEGKEEGRKGRRERGREEGRQERRKEGNGNLGHMIENKDILVMVDGRDIGDGCLTNEST
jgi:predicted transposase YdaD